MRFDSLSPFFVSLSSRTLRADPSASWNSSSHSCPHNPSRIIPSLRHRISSFTSSRFHLITTLNNPKGREDNPHKYLFPARQKLTSLTQGKLSWGPSPVGSIRTLGYSSAPLTLFLHNASSHSS